MVVSGLSKRWGASLRGTGRVVHGAKPALILAKDPVDVIEIGRRLIECKRVAGRGNWLAWLEPEFEWKERTAEALMNVHEAFGSNPQHVADLVLPTRGLYLLAAPSTPEEVLFTTSKLEDRSISDRVHVGTPT